MRPPTTEAGLAAIIQSLGRRLANLPTLTASRPGDAGRLRLDRAVLAPAAILPPTPGRASQTTEGSPAVSTVEANVEAPGIPVPEENDLEVTEARIARVGDV